MCVGLGYCVAGIVWSRARVAIALCFAAFKSARLDGDQFSFAQRSSAQLSSAQSTSANFSSVQLSLAQLTSGVARSVHTVMAANFGCDVLDAMRAHLSFCDEFPLRY